MRYRQPKRRGAIGLGLGIGLTSGGVSSGFTPPSSSALQLWLKGGGTFWQNSARTTPATVDGDPIGCWDDASLNANHAKQGTASKKLTLKTAGSGINGVSCVDCDGVDDIASLTSAVPLTGVFTAYAVGIRAAASAFVPFGSTASNSVLMVFSNNQVYVGDDAGALASVGFTGATGALICRWRRKADNTCLFRATGMAEASAGSLTTTVSFTALGARGGSGQYNSAFNLNADKLLYNSDLPTTDPAGDAAIIAYLTTKYALTF